jgi:hypothetical protein
VLKLKWRIFDMQSKQAPSVGAFVFSKDQGSWFTVVRRTRTKEEQPRVFLWDEHGVGHAMEDCWIPEVGDRVNVYYYDPKTKEETKLWIEDKWSIPPDPTREKWQLWAGETPWIIVILAIEGPNAWVTSNSFPGDIIAEAVRVPLSHTELVEESWLTDFAPWIKQCDQKNRAIADNHTPITGAGRPSTSLEVQESLWGQYA